jgi:hypothetical protein
MTLDFDPFPVNGITREVQNHGKVSAHFLPWGFHHITAREKRTQETTRR